MLQAEGKVVSDVLDNILRNPSDIIPERRNYPWPPLIDLDLLQLPRRSSPDDESSSSDDSPSLRILRLGHIHRDLEYKPDFSQYPLIGLEVTECPHLWTDVAALLDMLSHLPKLRDLALLGCAISPSSNITMDPVDVPALECLTLDDRADTIIGILHHIRSPESASLDIHSNFTPPLESNIVADNAPPPNWSSIDGWMNTLQLLFAPSQRQPALDAIVCVYKNVKRTLSTSSSQVHLGGYLHDGTDADTSILDVDLTCKWQQADMVNHPSILSLVTSKLPAFVSHGGSFDRPTLDLPAHNLREIMFFYKRVTRKETASQSSRLSGCTILLSRPSAVGLPYWKTRIGEITVKQTDMDASDDSPNLLDILPLIDMLELCFKTAARSAEISLLREATFVQRDPAHSWIFHQLHERFGKRVRLVVAEGMEDA